jgi:hypothetical protein
MNGFIQWYWQMRYALEPYAFLFGIAVFVAFVTWAGVTAWKETRR